MQVLNVRNVHEALPVGLAYLREAGVRRDSRNGSVIMSPVPVATVYERPWERVVFWPERDANPALHLYESLWMLAGRNDIAPLVRYSPNFLKYTDDGVTSHGAYGHRWRKHFEKDQISIAVLRLRHSGNDRRAVVQMWDPRTDAFAYDNMSDVPCNLTITFQIDVKGRLQMVVFNRSNDVVWGAYGANAVHMSFLHEYVARSVGVEMGTYTQVSVNYHAYEETSKAVWPLADRVAWPAASNWSSRQTLDYSGADAPYDQPTLEPTPIGADDQEIRRLLEEADDTTRVFAPQTTWSTAMQAVLRAHNIWKLTKGEPRFELSLACLQECQFKEYDWVVAMRQWIVRRYDRWTLAKSEEA